MRTSLLVVLLLGCKTHLRGEETPFTDKGEGTGDTGDTGFPSTPDARRFALVVTESPPGPLNNDPATWGGLLQYTVDENTAAFVPAQGVDKSELNDPVGLVYRESSGEIFVANRHGNNAADGVAGSISRFQYDPVDRSFTPSGVLTEGGLYGPHQVAFDPVTGDLYAANVNAGVSQFTFDAGGAAAPGVVVGSGPARGVIVSPSGQHLYVTHATDSITVHALPGFEEVGTVVVEPGANLHYFAWRGDELYVAGLDAGAVFRMTLGDGEIPEVVDRIPASSPTGVTFSQNGDEMYVAGHRDADVIERFLYDRDADAWVLSVTESTGFSLGSVLVLE